MKGKTTFKEEFVTAGGILLSSIDPNRMESKLLPGLFFAGEVMDVDGVTGGFNFQHAWTSGWVAANAITTIAHD
jgi:predicted flavoprotein YhiN